MTAPPSDADQEETNRIASGTVEIEASVLERAAPEEDGDPNVPTLPSTEPYAADEDAERESEMHRP